MVSDNNSEETIPEKEGASPKKNSAFDLESEIPADALVSRRSRRKSSASALELGIAADVLASKASQKQKKTITADSTASVSSIISAGFGLAGLFFPPLLFVAAIFAVFSGVAWINNIRHNKTAENTAEQTINTKIEHNAAAREENLTSEEFIYLDKIKNEKDPAELLALKDEYNKIRARINREHDQIEINLEKERGVKTTKASQGGGFIGALAGAASGIVGAFIAGIAAPITALVAAAGWFASETISLFKEGFSLNRGLSTSAAWLSVGAAAMAVAAVFTGGIALGIAAGIAAIASGISWALSNPKIRSFFGMKPKNDATTNDSVAESISTTPSDPTEKAGLDFVRSLEPTQTKGAKHSIDTNRETEFDQSIETNSLGQTASVPTTPVMDTKQSPESRSASPVSVQEAVTVAISDIRDPSSSAIKNFRNN